MNHVGEELHASAGFFAVIDGGEGEITSSEVGGKLGMLEAKFVDIGFIFENGKVLVESFDFGKVPNVV